VVALAASFALVALFSLVTMWAGSAAAHLGNLSYSEIVVRGSEVDFKLRFAAHLIPGTGDAMAEKLTRRDVVAREWDVADWLSRTVRVELGAAPCKSELVDSMGPDSNDDLTVVLHYACPAASEALRVEFRAFDEVMPDYQNIVSVRHAGGSAAFVFTAESRVLAIGEAGGGDAGGEAEKGGFYRFFVLGIEHILTGYDHLLFLLALLLPGGSIGRLAGIVTAFTAAHSITLALAALEVVTLPAAPVEAAIAASVVLAAFSGLRVKPDAAGDHRALLTFAFGLVHGFGFAGILRSSGLPADAVTLPLLAFNLGVEAGQLGVVLVALPIIHALSRAPLGRRLIRAAGWLIAAAGTFWLADRLTAWLS
jgi:hydrogenase/urease accessory protein HupE